MSPRSSVLAGSSLCFLASLCFSCARGSPVALAWWAAGIASGLAALGFLLRAISASRR
ncbi:MAG TPA: hypothetical protein VFS43_17675 [Polyangiaceae bacterium]|nr:hypothetical protein [Polyangiaceae bacterium]